MAFFQRLLAHQQPPVKAPVHLGLCSCLSQHVADEGKCRQPFALLELDCHEHLCDAWKRRAHVLAFGPTCKNVAEQLQPSGTLYRLAQDAVPLLYQFQVAMAGQDLHQRGPGLLLNPAILRSQQAPPQNSQRGY